jgi:transposase-like protein
MIKVKCRKCGSENIKKNGKTYTGKQKFHCKDCKFYGTLDTKDSEIKEKERLIEKLLLERVSQRAISRITGISLNTVVKIVKKKSKENI